ncbi:hypothetical protein J6590_084740 [Homalodisca vitripennis]|nr:hypothetical protein J6590_084740 [Homalodisca vitripennis]
MDVEVVQQNCIRNRKLECGRKSERPIVSVGQSNVYSSKNVCRKSVAPFTILQFLKP